MLKGGIMSYDMGGEVESQLENMDEKGLAEQAKESSSPSIRRWRNVFCVSVR
jgi:hypothetical protein